MRPRLPLSIVILLLVFCFALGLISAWFVRNPEDGAPATPLPAPREEQVNILIVGLDELASPQPELTALWIATFEPPGRDLFVTGIAVDATSPASEGRTLVDAFAWGEAGPSEGFLAAVAALAPLEPDAVIGLDRQGFAAVVDYLGGIELNGAMLDGTQAAAVLELLEQDPGASVAGQRRVLESMASSAGRLGASPDISPLTVLVPDHAYLSTPLNELVALTAPLLPLDPSLVHFDLVLASQPSPGD